MFSIMIVTRYIFKFDTINPEFIMWREYARRKKGVTGKRARVLAKLAKLSFIAVLILFLGSFIVFPLFAVGLPSPYKIVRREGFSTKILDRSGKILYDIFADQRRTPVKFEDVP
ncbi:hypothetical protein HY008_03385, partial [Candidatus Woesebacteria bacterium]|nr:hypothetical protein [Candidatus Woesebacteria bacterium]